MWILSKMKLLDDYDKWFGKVKVKSGCCFLKLMLEHMRLTTQVIIIFQSTLINELFNDLKFFLLIFNYGCIIISVISLHFHV